MVGVNRTGPSPDPLSLRRTLADPLSLRPKHAAIALGIGQRKLWELTSPRGPIPCARIGTCIVYPVDALRAWLAAESAGVAKGDASVGPADGSTRGSTPTMGTGVSEKGGPRP